MTPIITLQEITDTLETLNSELFAFLDPYTGDLVTLSLEEIDAIEDDSPTDSFPEWQQPVIEHARTVLNGTTYVRLPTSHDLHEYAVMQDFCERVADEQQRLVLLSQIRGSGAFRRFRETIILFDLKEEWYRFQRNALETIARDWLEEQNIPYQ